MKRKELLLTALILVLSVYYYQGNFNKLTYIYDKIFVSPYENGALKESEIIHVEIKNPVYSAKKSFVKGVVKGPENLNDIFMQVPKDVKMDAIKNSVRVNGFEAQGEPLTEDILQVTYDDVNVYIITDDYNENLALLVSGEVF